MTTPRVLNKLTDEIPPDAVYVGRPSKWGNPFIMPSYKRDEAVANHKLWLTSFASGSPIRDIEELRGKDLVCWCSPLPCHADTLLELANKEVVSK